MGGGEGEGHLTIDARVAATRERSYICPPMKIDFESRARAPERGKGAAGEEEEEEEGRKGEREWGEEGDRWAEGGTGGGVVKTLVSRPGIRVSRHNAGALIDRARARPRVRPARRTEGNAFVF